MNRSGWTVAVLALMGASVVAGTPPTIDETAPWAEGPVKDGLPTGQGRHFRMLIEVPLDDAGLEGVRNLPVTVTLDLATALAEAGYPAQSSGGRSQLRGFELDMDSFTLWETDASGAAIHDQDTPAVVAPDVLKDGQPFHPSSNPVVNLRWVLEGESSGDRHYVLYFDALHNGEKSPRQYSLEDETVLASSIGPGRGTRLYVPLQPLSGPQGQAEMRGVRITNLQSGTNEVRVHEYSNGLPSPSPTRVFADDLQQEGDRVEYLLGDFGKSSSSGGVLVSSDRPVVAEAFVIPPSQRSTFKGNAFLPSAGGGFVGPTFMAHAGAEAEQWAVHCPLHLSDSLPGGSKGCAFSLNGGASQEVPANTALQVTSGVGPQRLQTSVGQVAVQRTGSGLAAWPPLDGPGASVFMGHAEPTDALLVTSRSDNACLAVKSLGPGNPSLTSRSGSGRLCLDKGAFEEPPSWGTSWSRAWETGARHEGGPVRIEEWAGKGGIGVVSGSISGAQAFSALVVPQSPEGGRTYSFHLPTTSEGTPLGTLVMYAPFGGTSGTATLRETGQVIPIGPLQSDERFDLIPPAGGGYEITTNRPILLAWLKPGDRPLVGPVPGLTDAVDIVAGSAQYSGHALDILPTGGSEAVAEGEPGRQTRFGLTVHNSGRTIAGDGLTDQVSLTLSGLPDGWTAPTLSPRDFQLDPRGSEEVDVRLTVPATVDVAQKGVTLQLQAQSQNNPGLVVSQPLRINYVVKCQADLKVDGGDNEVEEIVAKGEPATYTVRLTNTGSAADNFLLDASESTTGWNQDMVPLFEEPAPGRTPELEPGESVEYLLTIAPMEDLPPQSRTILVAVSQCDSDERDSVRVVTSVETKRSFRVEVEEPTRTVTPGHATSFFLTVHNDADVPEELAVETVSTAPGWGDPVVSWVEESVLLEDVDGIVNIEPRSSITLELNRTVPDDAAPFEMALDRVRLRSQFLRDSPGSDTDLRAIADQVRGVRADLSTPQGGVLPGGDVELALDLHSDGNDEQTVQIHPNPPQDWQIQGVQDGPPWNITLQPDGSATLPLTLSIPEWAPPSSVEASTLRFTVTSRGLPDQVVSWSVPVLEAPRVEVRTDGPLALPAGQVTETRLPVRNTGNVPIDLTGRVDGLPSTWVTVHPASIPVRGDDHVVIRFDIPADADLDGAASLHLDHDGSRIATAALDLRVGAPRLAAALAGIVPLGDGRSTYLVDVTNRGGEPAHNVSVQLVDARGDPIDRFSMEQILPGANHTASVVGPADAKGLRITVTAAHNPTGRSVDLEAALSDDSSRVLPAPHAAVVGLAAAAACALRRWRP